MFASVACRAFARSSRIVLYNGDPMIRSVELAVNCSRRFSIGGTFSSTCRPPNAVDLKAPLIAHMLDEHQGSQSVLLPIITLITNPLLYEHCCLVCGNNAKSPFVIFQYYSISFHHSFTQVYIEPFFPTLDIDKLNLREYTTYNFMSSLVIHFISAHHCFLLDRRRNSNRWRIGYADIRAFQSGMWNGLSTECGVVGKLR